MIAKPGNPPPLPVHGSNDKTRWQVPLEPWHPPGRFVDGWWHPDPNPGPAPMFTPEQLFNRSVEEAMAQIRASGVLDKPKPQSQAGFGLAPANPWRRW